MLDFSWKVFSKTGSIDTYLLMKELERDLDDSGDEELEEPMNQLDAH
ncbi:MULTISPECIES: YqzL family protein [Bacillaceae]|nr:MULTISPECIES: YqzL family protein [Bacillaceae]UOE95679.1 YqzL family protein [Alkalihalobacillus sp. LMS39]